MNKLATLCNVLAILTNTNVLTFENKKNIFNHNSFHIMDRLNLTSNNINQIKSYLLDENHKTLIFEKISNYNLHYVCAKLSNSNIFFVVGPFLMNDFYYEKQQELYKLKKYNSNEYDFYMNLKKIKTISTEILTTIIYNLINSNFIELENNSNFLRENIFIEEIEPQKFNSISEDIELTNKRYHFENEKIKYIKLGDYKNAIKYDNLIMEMSELPQRIPSNVFRSLKNGLFISSGIIRKAVEELDIPPTLIHNLSSKFFSIIEQCSTLSEIKQVQEQIIKEYSLLCLFHHQKYNNFNPKIKTALLYIDINIKDILSLSSVSEFIGLNSEYFSRLFKKEVGLNFKDYIKNLKINIACNYILNKKYKTSEIAYKLGYSDVNSFSKFFKKSTGLTPCEFKNSNKKLNVSNETSLYFI
ncbi:MAG: helix-turn-helix domain-containing protein [Cetobacterium sp.]|uniref:helix-turn-helix domain-containing protein n=1 Tax=Cetobacterium sp. TaxID=2071632 RepID=UPI003F2E690D